MESVIHCTFAENRKESLIFFKMYKLCLEIVRWCTLLSCFRWACKGKRKRQAQQHQQRQQQKQHFISRNDKWSINKPKWQTRAHLGSWHFWRNTDKWDKMSLLWNSMHYLILYSILCFTFCSRLPGCSLGIRDWRILRLLHGILRVMFGSLWLLVLFIQTWSLFQNTCILLWCYIFLLLQGFLMKNLGHCFML